MKQLVFPTASAAESKALGQRLAHHLQAPIVIALHGDLGAGKTTFTQGIAAGLGIQQRVTSPTFTLVNEYTLENGWRLVHIDSYRLARGEAEGIGLEEILDDERAIVVIEWADRVADLLPNERIEIEFIAASEAESRTIIIGANGRFAEPQIQPLAA